MNRIVTGEGVWNKCDLATQQTLSRIIAKYGVVQMTVQTCGRAKQVCKSWYTAIDTCDTCEMLARFQPLFLPMFKRFVIFVTQIDLNPQTLKSRLLFGGNGHAAIVNCTQEEYRNLMFSQSCFVAYSGYKTPFSIDISSFQNNSWDMEYVCAASETLCTEFYKENSMPKCLNASQANTQISVEDEFFSMPIGVLCEKIDELKGNSELLTVYNRLVGLHP